MKNTFGSSVSLTVFGESHGPAVGAVIDGLAPGLEIDESYIAQMMDLRRPAGAISTQRHEDDVAEIVSGVFEGKTTGTSLCLIIKNKNVRSGDYEELRYRLRPGHADFTALEKYHGFADFRGGGHFSGRLTAPVVAAGAIIRRALEQEGILIGSHLKTVAGIEDRGFGELEKDIEALNRKAFAVLDESKGEEMKAAILSAAKDSDSVGGVIETAVIGLPSGLGEPWFDSVESLLSHALFSIPGVKGLEFGDGFALAKMRGSEANDPLRTDGEDIFSTTNRNGGINGGITNGSPLIFRLAVKPTPSIAKEQSTVDYAEKKNVTLSIKGRHDPAIVHRARVVADSLTALVLADLLAQRYGTDRLRGQK